MDGGRARGRWRVNPAAAIPGPGHAVAAIVFVACAIAVLLWAVWRDSEEAAERERAIAGLRVTAEDIARQALIARAAQARAEAARRAREEHQNIVRWN